MPKILFIKKQIGNFKGMTPPQAGSLSCAGLKIQSKIKQIELFHPEEIQALDGFPFQAVTDKGPNMVWILPQSLRCRSALIKGWRSG